MALWVRFQQAGRTGFGQLDGEVVRVHDGDMFDSAEPTGEILASADIELIAPCEPTKVIALWNNFHALAAKLGLSAPTTPLYLLKAISSLTDPDAVIRRPAGYEGRIVFEGELGIVIGRKVAHATLEEAASAIFGYTCVNDLTASDILDMDPTFPQWTRAKSFDGFGPFGPAIASGIDVSGASVTTVVDGAIRQNYAIADMVFPPAELVRRISRDMTLLPGDLICCGTSLGVGSLKGPVNRVEVSVEGIGTLKNSFEQ